MSCAKFPRILGLSLAAVAFSACLGRILASSVHRERGEPVANTQGTVAFVRGGDIWLTDDGGRKQRRLVPNGSCPVWSPNGTRIAFIRKGEAWVVPVSSPDRERRASHLGGEVETATWRSGDALFVVVPERYTMRLDWKLSGRNVRFRGYRPPGPRSEKLRLRDVLVVPLSGGAPSLFLGTALTGDAQHLDVTGGNALGQFCCPVVSPDGKDVAFIKDGDIWTMNNQPVEGPSAISFGSRVAPLGRLQLPVPVGDDYSAGVEWLDWSPDGRRFACDLERMSGTGIHEIWITDLNGGHSRKLAATGDRGVPGICRHPCFSVDDHAVLFEQQTSTQPEIWRVEVATGRRSRWLANAAQPDYR